MVGCLDVKGTVRSIDRLPIGKVCGNLRVIIFYRFLWTFRRGRCRSDLRLFRCRGNRWQILIRSLRPVLVPVIIRIWCFRWLSANAFYNMGAERVVLARELSFEEIAEIRAKTPKALEIEAFVHGAMCVSFSGRCLLSNYMTGRDANHGDCAQPCRWDYYLIERTRPDQVFTIEQDQKSTYVICKCNRNSLNDSCTTVRTHNCKSF